MNRYLFIIYIRLSLNGKEFHFVIYWFLNGGINLNRSDGIEGNGRLRPSNATGLSTNTEIRIQIMVSKIYGNVNTKYHTRDL